MRKRETIELRKCGLVERVDALSAVANRIYLVDMVRIDKPLRSQRVWRV